MSQPSLSAAIASTVSALIDDPQYESLLSLTTERIREQNYLVLEPLCADDEELAALLRQIEGYRLVERAKDLTTGAHVRWLPLAELDDGAPVVFQRSGMVCEARRGQSQDQGACTLVSCKNFMHRHYTFCLEECLVFQKLTPQERMVLQVMDKLADAESDSDGT